MVIYLIVWIGIALLLSIAVRHEGKQGQVTSFVCAAIGYIIYITFSVFRKIDWGYGGADAMAYYTFFVNASMPYLEYIMSAHPEFGFSSVLWIIRSMTDNYLWVLWLFHSFTYIQILIFIRYIRCKNIIAIMLLVQVLFSQFYTLRMSICITMTLSILMLMDMGKFKKALLLVLMSITIHKSAVILLPIWFSNLYFKYRSVTWKRTLALLFFYCAIAIFSYGMLIAYFKSTKYVVYLQQGSLGIGAYLFIFLITILALLKYEMLFSHKLGKVTLVSMTSLPICFIYNFYIPIFYRVMLILLQISYVLLALEQKMAICERRDIKFSLFTLCCMYAYFIIRFYRFFSAEVQYIGVPYVSTLFS